MKKKTENTTVTLPQERHQSVQQTKDSWRARIFPCVFPVLIFLSIASQGSRLFSIVLVVLTLFFGIGKEPVATLRQRISPLFLFVIFYVVLCFAAGLYSDFGDTAVVEWAKTLSAFAMFMMAIFCLKQEKLRLILRSVTASFAAFGLISIDGSSWNVLTPAFARAMRLLGSEYHAETMGYEDGVRITGVFSNANVSAGLLAFGILISLYLLRTEESKKLQIADYFILGVNAMAFFLSFSMGAMAAFGLACLIYLLATCAQERLELFFLMLASIIMTLLFAFPSYACLGKSGFAAFIPILCAAINGLGILLLQEFVVKKLLSRLNGHGKIIGITVVGLITLAAVYIVLAMSLTGSITLQEGTTLSRATYLDAGTYSVTHIQKNGNDTVTIYSQSEPELMMHTQTILYTGVLEQASFTVPEGSRVVWFDIAAGESGLTLSSVSLSDGIALKLGYRLLPGFVANRLQGLRTNQNFIQRLVFFRDGIKLWKQSPAFGFGLSAVEGRLTQVQSFYYESKYIHNHFIQVLDEMGIVGLITFVGMLTCALIGILKQRKEQTSLFPVLCACMAMMIAHSQTEVVWSTSMYQITIFLIFSIIIIAYRKPIAKVSHKGASVGFAIVIYGFSLVSALMMGGSMIAQKEMAAIRDGSKQITKREELLGAMQKLISMDAYDNEQYKVNYIANALVSDNVEYLNRATEYAWDLRNADEYTACSDVAKYYFLQKGQIKEFFSASQAAITQEASNKDAWNNQLSLYRHIFASLPEESMQEYVLGVLMIQEYLNTYSEGRMEKIELSDENQAFLNLVDSVKGQTVQVIYTKLDKELKP